MWQDNEHHRTNPWTQAKAYCDNLNLNSYTDWRLPTQDELSDIMIKTTNNATVQFKAIGPNWCFIGGTDQPNKAVAINNKDDLKIGDKFNTTVTTTRSVRCVRNN
jgi:hypothetical protein